MLVVLLLCVLPAYAAGAPAVSLDAQAGWSGWIPPGAWVPLRVDLLASDAVDGIVVVDVPLPRESAAMSFRRPVRLGPGARQHIRIDIIVPDVRRAITVRLLSHGRELTRIDLPLSASRAVEGVVLALTHEPAGLEMLSDFPRRLRPAYITEAELPSRWQGYAGVRLLAVRDLDATAVSPDQQQALEEWVIQGGRLLVTGGERLALLRAPWLVTMLPAVPAGLTVVRSSALLPGVGGPVPAAVLSVRRGASSRGPLIAQWPWGAGGVTVWAFDAFAPALRAWPGRAALWEEVLGTPVRPWLAPRELADALPVSRPLPGGIQAWLVLLSVVYILAARFALVRAGRVRSGWLAVPAVALVFTLAMYGFALQARRAGTTVVQASVVEVISGTGTARVRSALSLISPYGGTFALVAPPGAGVQPVEPHPLTFDGPGTVSGRAPVSGLRLDAQQIVSMPVEGRVTPDASGLRVEIENHSAVGIGDALVFRSGQVYRLPRLGETASVHLDPARWEAFARPANPPAAPDDRLLDEVLARLPRQPAGADTAWLVGWIVDPRLAFRGRPMEVEVHQLLVLPLRTVNQAAP